MASRCDSNTAQYERNRSFGHLVHALGRAAGGAKLPSAGLCLNASKAEASLAESGKDMLTVELRESGGSKQCDFTSRAALVRRDVEAHLDLVTNQRRRRLCCATPGRKAPTGNTMLQAGVIEQ
ncbi:unnamed protein product, partial [Iphiclides podalirius]